MPFPNHSKFTSQAHIIIVQNIVVAEPEPIVIPEIAAITDPMILAEVPIEYREPLSAIIQCESRWNPGAIGDHGNSLGAAQLWSGWFYEGEDPFDLVTNLRVATRVRSLRGRFGGGGGWTCADILGIY